MNDMQMGSVSFGSGGKPERLLPAPPPRGVLYGQDTVDALRARIAELEALLWDVCGYEAATSALPLSLCARIDAALGTENDQEDQL